MNSIKVCEYSMSLRSFHDDLILQDQASGERSQDHWSSSIAYVFPNVFVIEIGFYSETVMTLNRNALFIVDMETKE